VKAEEKENGIRRDEDNGRAKKSEKNREGADNILSYFLYSAS
jgi:hypothetical protein